jgi:hypothetical protein
MKEWLETRQQSQDAKNRTGGGNSQIRQVSTCPHEKAGVLIEGNIHGFVRILLRAVERGKSAWESREVGLGSSDGMRELGSLE